jgi:uncharacterized protein (DUF952 family)
MEPFYHIIDRDAWRRAEAAGSYHPASLDAEGFIHCSYPAQVLMPANALYRGQANLALLRIDPARLTAPVQHDPVEVTRDGAPATEDFPHIYGPLNADAVVAVIAFPPNADGTFRLPAELIG